jgi:hypothetical protein
MWMILVKMIERWKFMWAVNCCNVFKVECLKTAHTWIEWVKSH